MESIITIENLSVAYGDKKILSHINMDIAEKKITAIIGPSGCGKSTLLKTINRMTEEENCFHSTGSILLRNLSTKEMTKEEVRRRIGLVFQNPTCFPFSIYKNMTYALEYYGYRDKKLMEQMIEEKLKITGLYEEVAKDLKMSALKLSGGQQQRLCIARALTANPDVLLMDEPCSALDIKNTKNIENMLVDLAKKYTIVIVTHNLAQAKRIADYTAFILDGELVEMDETQGIFSNPKDERTREYIEGIYG